MMMPWMNVCEVLTRAVLQFLSSDQVKPQCACGRPFCKGHMCLDILLELPAILMSAAHVKQMSHGSCWQIRLSGMLCWHVAAATKVSWPVVFILRIRAVSGDTRLHHDA